MTNLKAILNKQGGKKLLLQYFQSGVLFTAVVEFLLLGRNRVALEILRLSTHLKVKRKLQKRYKHSLAWFDKNYVLEPNSKLSNKVWVCWFQGMEQAPKIVKKCYQSLKENLSEHEVVVITIENISDYVQFPDYILEKWNTGKITHTHMTDLLRLELLTKYGGLWIDATVLCTEKEENIPAYFFNSDLFFYQCLKPGRDGHSHINSSWLICAKPNNKVLMACKHLCYEYWKDHNSLIDYFLLHDFMAICLEYYSEEWLNIVPRDNASPHILLLRLFEQYDEQIWKAVKEQTPFHKLTYKFAESEKDKTNTYYDEIIN